MEKESYMKYQIRISFNPGIMRGKPVVAGTRITVELILKKKGEGVDVASLLSMYPSLNQEDVLAVFEYAAAVISNDHPIDSVG